MKTQILGIIRNVSFGLKSFNNQTPLLTLIFEVCMLDRPNLPFAFQGESLERFMQDWGLFDIKLLERMPVVFEVDIVDSKENINLVKPFVV